MAQSGDQIFLPDLYAALPFKDDENPLFDVVRKEPGDWIDGYEIPLHHRRAGFTSTYSEPLASHSCPYVPHDAFRVLDEALIQFVLETL